MMGHTHDQYFSVTNSLTNPEKHINVAQIGPSVTTSAYKNPAYGLITVDKETMLPTNYQIYAMDIEKANKYDAPLWDLSVDYKHDYDLDDIRPDAMYSLAERVRTDRSFAGLYKYHMARKVGAPKEISAKEAKQIGCMLGTSEETE
jgi:hypothetical protein